MTKELLVKIQELEKAAGKPWINQFKGLGSIEKIKNKASELNVGLTNPVANEILALLSKANQNRLSEVELSAIAGGVGEGEPPVPQCYPANARG